MQIGALETRSLQSHIDLLRALLSSIRKVPEEILQPLPILDDYSEMKCRCVWTQLAQV